MDGQNAPGRADRRAGKLGPQIDGHQRGLPVVAVHDVGNPVKIVEYGQCGLGEEAVARNIVNQIGVGVAVAEEILVVDEVIDHTVPDILHDADIKTAAVGAEIHIELAAVDHLILILLRDAAVAREDDLDVAVLLHQGARQRVHHITETAGLDEGIALGADEGHAAAGRRQRILLFPVGSGRSFFLLCCSRHRPGRREDRLGRDVGSCVIGRLLFRGVCRGRLFLFGCSRLFCGRFLCSRFFHGGLLFHGFFRCRLFRFGSSGSFCGMQNDIGAVSRGLGFGFLVFRHCFEPPV